MIFPSLPRPHNWAGVRRLGRGAAVVLSTLVVLGSACPAPAQPPGDEGRVSQEQQATAYRWRELQNQMSAVELTEPQQALAVYQAFYETSGHQYVEVAVGVTSRIAQVYGRNLKNPAKALELYAWALEQWGDTPYQDRLQREAAQMKALLAGAGADNAGASKVAPKGGAAKAGVGVVPVVPVAPVKAIGVPSLGSVPLVVKAPSAAGAPPTVGVAFSIGGSKLAVALNEIETGCLSAEEAWTRGELSVAQARALLEQLNPWGKVEGRIGNETRRVLARLVVAHEPQLIESPAALTLAQRLWIGDALGDARDGRCVALLGSAIEELKGQGARLSSSEVAGAFIASERLAWFYRDTGQTEKVAQTWMGVPVLLAAVPLSESQKWMVPEALLEAARAYNQLGQHETARALYAQVPQYGNGWFTGLVLYDQASALISQSKHQEARQLLTTPIKGQDIEQIQVAIESLLSLSYYKTGDLALAKQHSQNALQQASAITIPKGKGLEGTISVAEAIQNFSAQWDKNPISVVNENFRLVLAPDESNEAMLTRHLFVRTLRDVPLIATVDDARIKVRVTGNKQENDYFVQNELLLEVPRSLNQSVDATLTVSSPQFTDYQTQTPLYIEVPKPIQLSSSSVFFGEVKVNEPTTRKLTLSAAVPFRVVDVKADTAALEVQSPAPQAAKEQIITLIFTSPHVGRFYNGTIRIQTDVPGEEVIEMPYIARIR